MDERLDVIRRAVFPSELYKKAFSNLFDASEGAEDFFNSVYSLGVIMLSTSMILLLTLRLILPLLLNIQSTLSGIASTIAGLNALNIVFLLIKLPKIISDMFWWAFYNITPVGIVLFITAIIIRELIKNVRNSNPPLDTFAEWLYNKISESDRFSTPDSNDLAIELVVWILTGINIVVLFMYRSTVLIGDVPPPEFVIIRVIQYGLIAVTDLGYLGLFLVAVGQIHFAYRMGLQKRIRALL